MSAVADLVAAGYGVSAALEVLPRRSLTPRASRQLASEVVALHSGGPLDVALERLGFEITPAVLRGSQSRTVEVEAALRADAAARAAADQELRKTRSGVQLFAIIVGALALLTLLVAFLLVPRLLGGLATMAEGTELPPALVRFEQFRDTWLALGAGFLLAMVALIIVYAGVVGRSGWTPFLQDLRLYLPFLRQHAIRASSARLLEALAHEEEAGIPANETIQRIKQREPVPRLRSDLGLAEARLSAGDPWQACLRGTLLDTPTLADLVALASHGAPPTQGWRWAAARNRELAVKSLRHAIVALAVLVLVPSFLYLLVLLNASLITSSVAQIENLKQEIELLTDEVERIFQQGR